MTMRVKFIIIFLLTFLLSLGALIWRADQALYGDYTGKAEARNRQQISAIVDALDLELQNMSNILSLSFSEIEKMAGDYSAGPAYGKFQMLAGLNPPAVPGGEWSLGAPHFLEKTEVRNWAVNYISLSLKTIKPGDFQMGFTQLFTINDPQRKPFILLVSRGIRQWYVALLNTNTFQRLMDRQKGQIQDVFVVNSQGQALGHTTQEYVGRSLAEDPIVTDIIKGNLASGSGQFVNLKGEKIQGIYEKIPMSNVFAVVTSSLGSTLSERSDFRTQLVILGLGLCLIGIALVMYVFRNDVFNTEPDFSKISTALPPAVVPMKSQVLAERPSTDEASNAYKKLAATLSNELKAPLTSIVGNVQLALNMVSEQKVIDHLRRADREARSAREIVQKLLTFAGEDKHFTGLGNLEIIVQKALKNFEGRMSLKGIQVIKHIESVVPFTMPIDNVQKAIESIFTNAIEAMERAPKKQMTVTLKADGPDIILSVADTGDGMSQDAIDKAFDPFYTTRSGTQHVGLGLSTSRSIFKQAHGDMSIQSEKGKGTTINIIFKPQEQSLAGAAEVPVASPPVAPSLPSASAQQVAPEKPALKTLQIPAVSQEPLLVDNSIDQLIDGAEPEELVLESKKISIGDDKDLPAAPSTDIDDKTMDISIQSPSESGFSAKIDKPKIELKKKTSKLDESPIAIRKPGVKT